jgi:hypothetical protein
MRNFGEYLIIHDLRYVSSSKCRQTPTYDRGVTATRRTDVIFTSVSCRAVAPFPFDAHSVSPREHALLVAAAPCRAIH